MVFVNEFWLFREHLSPLNDTVKDLTLGLSYNPISMMKWQMFSQMEQSFQMQISMGTAAEGESDEFKRMLIETNPYFLALTFVVTILHSVFDFLAFRNGTGACNLTNNQISHSGRTRRIWKACLSERCSGMW